MRGANFSLIEIYCIMIPVERFLSEMGKRGYAYRGVSKLAFI